MYTIFINVNNFIKNKYLKYFNETLQIQNKYTMFVAVKETETKIYTIMNIKEINLDCNTSAIELLQALGTEQRIKEVGYYNTVNKGLFFEVYNKINQFIVSFYL